MQIQHESIDNICAENEIWGEWLTLDNADVLELGCGAAELTRQIAADAPTAHIVAMEVDETQHAINLSRQQEQRQEFSRIRFVQGGAEAIPTRNDTFDAVFMFKSLHHVPMTEMSTALNEIRRVLKTGGRAYISEPIFAGDFNEILRLFHDEEQVRKAAFNAVKYAVKDGRLSLVEEVFFLSRIHFTDFADFEKKVLGVSHTQHQLSASTYQQVKAAFAEKMTNDGADFLMPMRVDVLEVTQ